MMGRYGSYQKRMSVVASDREIKSPLAPTSALDGDFRPILAAGIIFSKVLSMRLISALSAATTIFVAALLLLARPRHPIVSRHCGFGAGLLADFIG
jgi:hypothetical protein